MRVPAVLAWLFHAAINTAGSQLFVGDQVRQWWLSGIVYGLAALIIILVTGPGLARRPASRAEAVGVSQAGL